MCCELNSGNSETVLLLTNSDGWNWNQSKTSIRWLNVNIFGMTRVKLRIRLENFKCVFARVCFKIAMTSVRLSFASVEIDINGRKDYVTWLAQPGSFFRRPRKTEKREPGNEVALLRTIFTSYGRTRARARAQHQEISSKLSPAKQNKCYFYFKRAW